MADGFRNYIRSGLDIKADEMLVDKAQLLKLTAPEMVVLIGGMRVLNANYDKSSLGVLTNRPEVLTNDFFVNVLDMNTKWKPIDDKRYIFEGIETSTGDRKWMATRTDLIFGSHSQLRAF